MAKIAPILGLMSGKLGGDVFANNAAGQYVRQWVVPVNPNTPAQNGARGRLSAASDAWQQLTDTNKDRWEAIAAALPPKIGRMGVPYQLNGQQLFIWCNAQHLELAAALWYQGPNAWIPPLYSGCTYTFNALGPNYLEITAPIVGGGPLAALPANTYMLVDASPLFQTGRRFPSRLARIRLCGPTTPFPLDCTANWEAKYGGPLTPGANGRIFVRTQLFYDNIAAWEIGFSDKFTGDWGW